MQRGAAPPAPVAEQLERGVSARGLQDRPAVTRRERGHLRTCRRIAVLPTRRLYYLVKRKHTASGIQEVRSSRPARASLRGRRQDSPRKLAMLSSGMPNTHVPTPFIIMRSSGHSGSGWLSQLFQTQRLAFFFEFTGRCEKGHNVTVELDRTFEEGCSCARSAVPLTRLAAACRRPVEKVLSGDPMESQNCEKLALCHTSCPGPAPTPFACQAVGMVQSASAPWLERIAAFQLSRAAVKGAPEARLVTFERDNARWSRVEVPKQTRPPPAPQPQAFAPGLPPGPERSALLRCSGADKRRRRRSGAGPKSPVVWPRSTLTACGHATHRPRRTPSAMHLPCTCHASAVHLPGGGARHLQAALTLTLTLPLTLTLTRR